PAALWIHAQRMERGRPVGKPAGRVLAGGPGPSYVNLPSAGCWRLELSWSGLTDTLDLAYGSRRCSARCGISLTLRLEHEERAVREEHSVDRRDGVHRALDLLGRVHAREEAAPDSFTSAPIAAASASVAILSVGSASATARARGRAHFDS